MLSLCTTFAKVILIIIMTQSTMVLIEDQLSQEFRCKSMRQETWEILCRWMESFCTGNGWWK